MGAIKPGSDVTACFGRRARAGKNSYGNNFITTLKFEKIASNEEVPCTLEWWEAMSIDFRSPRGELIVPKARRRNMVGIDSQLFTKLGEHYAETVCPSRNGRASGIDCPFTPLVNNGDSRLLCIEIVWKSSCDNCAVPVVRKYVKQKCRMVNGNASCKLEISDKPCSKEDWKEFGIDIGDGPEIWPEQK